MDLSAAGIVLGVISIALGVHLLRHPDLLFRYAMLGRGWMQEGRSNPSANALLAGRILGVVIIAAGVLIGLGFVTGKSPT